MSKLMSEIPTENENFLRFVLFFIEVGTETVLKVFYHYQRLHPTIVTFPIGNNDDLSHVLYYGQYHYVINAATPAILDTSALTTILQTLFSDVLQAPVKGWGSKPPKYDISISADLLRLRYIRNDIVAHSYRANLQSDYFGQMWKRVEQILRRLVEQVDPGNQTKLEETFIEYKQKTIGASCAKKCKDYLTKQVNEMTQLFKDKQDTPYLRYIKLLVDGGRSILTAYLNKLIKDNNVSLQSVLLERQSSVVEEFGGNQTMFEQIYPTNEEGVQTVNTDTKYWDMSVLAKVTEAIFATSVDEDDLKLIKAVREARESYAYTALHAITKDEPFQREREDLMTNLSLLAKSIGGDSKQKFNRIKEGYRSPSFEMTSEDVEKYLIQLKWPGLDIKDLHDIHKECVDKLRTDLLTTENIYVNVNENLELEIIIQVVCQDKEKQKEAESTLVNFMKAIIANPDLKIGKGPDFPEVRRTLLTIKGIPSVRLTCVKKSCLLITVQSSSSEALMSIVDYVDSSKFKNDLDNISIELKGIFGEVFLSNGHFTLESIQKTLIRIERKTENNSVNHDVDYTQDSEIITTYEYMAQDTKNDLPAQGETIIYDRGERDKKYLKTTESESETETNQIWQELRHHQRRLFRDSDLLEGHLEQAREAYKSLHHGILHLTDEMQKFVLQLKFKESLEEEKQDQHIVELLKPLEDLRNKVEKEIDRSQQIRLETFGLKEVKMEFESLLERAEQQFAELKECSFKTDLTVGG